MANNAKCIFFLLLTLCLSLQSHARDSKFFSKLAKQNHDSISLSPTMAPTLAPSPSPEAEEFIEHGYGLYGQDPFQSYEYAPTTTNPTKVSGEKFISADDLSNVNNFIENGNGNGNRKGNGIDEKQGMSDTRFLENGKYYYNTNQDNVKDESSSDYFHKGKGNGYEMERQGMSDTRFLENGKYFHDINEDEEKNGHFNTNNFENENEKFEGVEEENNGHFNTNNYENEEEFEEDEKHGLSDTRFMENGNYYSNMNEEAKQGGFEIRDNRNGNGNGNQNENFEMEKHGLSDTRFLENGKYFYDVNNEKGHNHYDNHNNKFGVEDVNDERVNNNNKFGVEDVGFHSNNNVEFANTYNNGNGYENEYETEATGGYNYHPNEYHVNEGNGAKPKKYVYDTMEEYDREQGYIDGPEHYRP